MHMRITSLVVTMALGAIVFTGCSKPSSSTQSASNTTEATAAPRATIRAAARRATSTPASETRTVALSPRPRTMTSPRTTTKAPVTVSKTVAPKVTPKPAGRTRTVASAGPARPSAKPTPSSTPSVVSVTGAPIPGRQLYMQYCSSCHGANAQGGMGPSLQNEASRKNLAQAIAWIKNPALPMPSLYPGSLNDKDVLDIATYVESLR